MSTEANEALPFEIEVDGRRYILSLGNCAVVLFRQQQEVDYLTIDRGVEDPMQAFNNPDMCHYIAGYQITEEDGELHRLTTLYEDATFRTRYGWNPPTVEKERPSDKEMEDYLEIATRDLEDEWQKGLDG